MSRALIVDVDGVISPVHGHTAWGDDVVAGHVFGPVLVSPTLCDRLDALASHPDLRCAWLTSWSSEMRAAMDPFPGRAWPSIAQGKTSGRRTWWKRTALEAWLDQHHQVDALCWLDDHLSPSSRAAAIRRRLATRGIDTLLVAPTAAVGLTPQELSRVEGWLYAGGAVVQGSRTPRAPIADQKAATDVQALNADSVGRWLVYTRHTCHFLDLEERIYERLPGPGSSSFEADAEHVRLSRVSIWPKVGSRMMIWFDDPDRPDAVEHWRISAHVQRITPAP